MKKLSNSGFNDYDVFNGDNVVLSQRNAACFSNLFRFGDKYTKIRVLGLDCEPSSKYKNFYLQYIIEMFDLEGASFNDEFIEFNTTGQKYKDLVVMTALRILWENICGSYNDGVENVQFFLENLQNGKCEHEDKLERFCYFYALIQKKEKCYYGDNHMWYPWNTKIKSTQDFKTVKGLSTVNGFFYH